jgi:sec-independent protein translocase protein TatA
MGIGSLGLSELVVIFVIVLVFFGPRRFPEIARSMGHAMREFRRSLNQIQRELEEADPRSSIPGRDFLNDLGKPGQWMDPNSSRKRTGAEGSASRGAGPAARQPPEAAEPRAESAGPRDEAAEPYPDPEGRTSVGSDEQLPIFEGGEADDGGGEAASEGLSDEPDPRQPTGDRPDG